MPALSLPSASWIRCLCCRGKARNLVAIVGLFITWACLVHSPIRRRFGTQIVNPTPTIPVTDPQLSSEEIVFNQYENNIRKSGEVEIEANSPVDKIPHLIFLDKLFDYYRDLGIEITKYENAKVFNDLFQNSDTSFWNKATDFHNLNVSIHLKYPVYEQHLPKFIDPKHRDIFLEQNDYKDALGIHNSSYMLDGHLELFRGGKVTSEFRCGQRTNVREYKGHFEKVTTISNKATANTTLDVAVGCPLLVPESSAFQHFVDGVLPKFAQLKPFLDHPNIRFILQRPRKGDESNHEMLEQMGIDRNRIVFTSAKEKVNTEYQLNACIAPPTHPVLMKETRRLLGVSDSITIPMESAYVVLLTRKGSHNGGRNIINQNDVIRLMEERYGDKLVIFPGPMGLRQTKEIFGAARLIIGVHGGALYNIHFASRDAVIVEYLGVATGEQLSKGLSHGIFWILSENAGQTYYRVFEDALNIKRDINVNIKKLVKLLDEVDSKQLK